jgi:hypothetical protein
VAFCPAFENRLIYLDDNLRDNIGRPVEYRIEGNKPEVRETMGVADVRESALPGMWF